MEVKDSYITLSELQQAWKNWLYFHRGIHCEETEERFFNYCHSLEQSFIDDPLNWDADDQDVFHVAANTAYRVKLIAGSDFNTLLNVYYVNHPWKTE